MAIRAGGLLDTEFAGGKETRGVIREIDQLAAQFAARVTANDLQGSFPEENFRDLRQRGLMALQVPAEFGGRGLTPLEYIAAIAVMAGGDPSTALAYNMHSTAMVSIEAMASREQKRRWFEKVVRHGTRVAALGSEPHLKPFIDGALPQTRLIRTGDGYRLSGKKNYCSFGPNAELLYVAAALEDGIAFAMVDAHAEGIRRQDDWRVMSMRSTASVTTEFHEVQVDQDDVIVPANMAMALMLEIEFALGYGPVYLAASAAGCQAAIRSVKPALDEFLSTAEGRLHPDVGFAFSTVGKIYTTLEAAWLMCQKAAQAGQIGSFDRAAAIVAAKAVACDAACEAAALALKLSGGRGLATESPIGRAFRDVQAGQVMAFSPEQARAMIGRLALGYAPEYIRRLMENK